MDELDDPIANIRGRVRNVRRKPKQVEHACNVEDEGLLRGVGPTVLTKRNKRDHMCRITIYPKRVSTINISKFNGFDNCQ